MCVNESTQLFVIDTEIMEETLQKGNHLDKALVSHQNEHLDNAEPRVSVHDFSIFIQQFKQRIGILCQLLHVKQ